MLPFSSDLILLTFNPDRAAEDGFVPWADSGIRQIFLCYWPMLLKYLSIASRPVNSPFEPELGYKETASNPVKTFKYSESFYIIKVYPLTNYFGANG